MPKRILQGVVVSTVQDKTVTVRVERRVKPGRIMFEMDGVPMPVAKRAMELAAAKLPVKTKFIARLGESI